MATDAQRALLVQNADILIAYAPKIHYLARRPMKNETDQMVNVIRRFKAGIGMWLDCSEFVSMLFHMASLEDPNGLGYNGWGNSGTMYQHLPHYEDPANAHPGALVVYGPGGDDHVAMVIKRDKTNPRLVSMGSEIGPLDISLNAETRAHAGQPRAFLDISHL